MHPPETESREFCFLPCVGDERARPIYLFSSTGPRAISSSAVCERLRGKSRSRCDRKSEKRTIGDAGGTPRARSRRFDLKSKFYAVFYFILVHFLDFTLNFPDDISGAAACGLTTRDLIHRAGPALMERAPRPSLGRTG